MIISPLQKESAHYSPKLPLSLKGAVKLTEGVKTQSVDDQKEIEQLFPHTYGMPLIVFEKGDQNGSGKPLNVGVILSGGQAPGGLNVITGIFDGI